MRKISIICGCGRLVDVADKVVATHHRNDGEICQRNGARYVPSPRSTPTEMLSPRGNPMELVAAAEIPCSSCEEHPVAIAALFAETLPQIPRLSTLSETRSDYPEWKGPISSTVN